MKQAELEKILREHKKWLKNPSEGKRANLSGVNLSYANLYKANLSEANLSGANLSCAYLSKANFSKANLSRANLKDIAFDYVWLSECNYETFIKQAELTEYFLVKPIYDYIDYALYKDFSLLEEALKDEREIIRIVRNN